MGKSNIVRGEVRGVSVRSRTGPSSGMNSRRQTQRTTDILTFRIECFDEAGNKVATIPVEMKGTLSGVLNEGDSVEVIAKWRPGITLHPERVLNLTTGGTVETGSSSSGCLILLLILLLVLGAVMVLFMTRIIH